MITRRGLAEEIDRLDQELASVQRDKAQMYAAYREQIENEGATKADVKIELAAFKLAMKIRQERKRDPSAVDARDALLDEILTEIGSGTQNAPRARTRRKPPPSTGEVSEQPAA